MKPSRSPANRQTGRLGFLLLGFVSLLIQTLLIREALFASHGGEIVLGLFFAIWLVGIAGGATAGSLWVRRTPHPTPDDTERTHKRFAAGLVLLVWIGAVALGVMRHHRLWVSLPVGGFLPAGGYVLLLLATALPVGGLTGLLFPIGLLGGRIRPGSGYAWESLGSMLGGAVTALWALPRFSALEILAGAGVVALAYTVGGIGRWFARGASGLLLVALLAGVVGQWDDAWLEHRWRGLGNGSKATLNLDTPYHHITLADLNGESSLYLDGLYQGDVADAYVDSLQAALIMGVHPAPKRMIVIAPALLGTAGVLASARGTSLHLFRLDARCDQAIGDHHAVLGRQLNLLRQAGHMHAGDPRELLRRHPEEVDLIVILGAGPVNGAQSRLYTREFFHQCARRLLPGGALVLTLPGTANVASPWGTRMRAAVFAALEDAFKGVRILPGEMSLLIGSAPRGRHRPEPELVFTPDSLSARRARAWPTKEPWPAAYFARLMPTERQQALQRRVEREAAESRPHADRYPHAIYAQLRQWDHLTGGALGGLLGWWHDHPWVGAGGLLLILGGMAAGVRRRWGQAAMTISTTGLVGMALNLTILLLFQAYRGALYLKVGLVTGLFMVGLALGAAWGQRGLRSQSGVRLRSGRALAFADGLWVLALAAAILALPLLDRCSPRLCETVLLGGALAGGLLTGLPFPRAAEVWRLRREGGASAGEHMSLAYAGGAADAADHAGAVLGGLLAGTFLVPLLGYAGALLCLLVVKLLSTVGALLDR